MLAGEEWWRRFSYFCPCWLVRGGGGDVAISAHAGWDAEVGLLDIDLIPDLRSKGVKGRTLGIETCK
jgi:hypothetical protein